MIGEFEVGGRMSTEIRETVGALRERDVEVILVWLPQAPRFLDLLPDRSSHAAARSEAERLAADLDISFIDVSDGYGNEDFTDFTHLSGEAARRVSIAARRRARRTEPPVAPLHLPVSSVRSGAGAA